MKVNAFFKECLTFFKLTYFVRHIKFRGGEEIMSKQMDLSENMENYLEAILDIEKINKVARAKDIAELLGLQKGSVSGALKVLKGL